MHENRSMLRRGSSLVIMLTTIAAGAVIVGVAVLVLIRVMGFNGAAGDHLARTVAVARLAEQFRSDVAAARSAEVTEPAVGDEGTGERPTAEADQQQEGGGPQNAEPDNQAERNQRLKLTLGAGQTITYDIHDGAIERTVEKDGQRQHFEHYAPAGLAAVALEVVNSPANAAAPQFARLRLEKRHLVESHFPQPARSVVIEAQVGRDHRFVPREARP